jgi:hypothetical protein
VTNQCKQEITIGKTLSSTQKFGLDLVAKLGGGRDVVFAIDLTESVGINDTAKIHLRQIVRDSLNSGDTVYILPFATTINYMSEGIIFRNKPEDIEAIIAKIPQKADLSQNNTDIQAAEAFIYPKLAQINQCRLQNNQPIKPQSIVWLTDAPLFTAPGITSDVWIETPGNSAFRNSNSNESKNRENWLTHLDVKNNARELPKEKYTLTVVDLPPTVQEFCTPAPGGKETCLGNSYIVEQLWLPALICTFLMVIISGGGILAVKYWLSLGKTWKLEIQLPNDEDSQIRYLSNQRSLSIGEDIECLGGEIRGYLKRQGNRLIMETTNILPLIYRGKKITQKQVISGNIIRLNCPHNDQDYDITIKVNK